MFSIQVLLSKQNKNVHLQTESHIFHNLLKHLLVSYVRQPQANLLLHKTHLVYISLRSHWQTKGSLKASLSMLANLSLWRHGYREKKFQWRRKLMALLLHFFSLTHCAVLSNPHISQRKFSTVFSSFICCLEKFQFPHSKQKITKLSS